MQKNEQWFRFSLTLNHYSDQIEGKDYLNWIQSCSNELSGLPACGFIIDMGGLLAGLKMTELVPINKKLRSAIQEYEEQLLLRLQSDYLWRSLMDAYQRCPVSLQSKAIALMVYQICQNIQLQKLTEINPGIFRHYANNKENSVVIVDTAIEHRLIQQYRELAECARNCLQLINQTDIFLVENISRLGDLHQRLAIEKVVQAASELALHCPEHFKIQKKQSSVSTKLQQTDNYPIGGFSSITNSGSIESLVTSELIYM